MLRSRIRVIVQRLMSPPVLSALGALAVLAPTAAILATIVGWQVDRILSERTLDALRSDLKSFHAELYRGGPAGLAAAVAARSAERGRGSYRLDLPGSGGAIGNLGEPYEQVGGSGQVFEIRAASDGRTRTVAGIAVPVPGGGRLLVVHDMDDQVEFLRYLRAVIFGGVAALTALALALGWYFTRRFARRVAGMTETSRSIMAGDLSLRIPRDRSGDDLDRLASGLNAMLTRIEDLMQALREVSDNIAHDLKTPLTRLRNRAEAALRDTAPAAHRDGLEKTIEEADGLIQTFNALLLIARLEAGAVDATRTKCDLAGLVSDVAELYQPVADDAGLMLDMAPAAPLPAAVNRQLVGQAVANLIDNAIKYSAGTPNSAAGPIVVSVLALPSGGAAITVADRGPGIPSDDRDRATKRFVRLEQSRSRPGTGLGLSLVAAVARLHGGGIALEDNAPGLRITLTLNAPEKIGSSVPANESIG